MRNAFKGEKPRRKVPLNAFFTDKLTLRAMVGVQKKDNIAGLLPTYHYYYINQKNVCAKKLYHCLRAGMGKTVETNKSKVNLARFRCCVL